VCVSAEWVFIQLKIEVRGSLQESIAYGIVAVYYFSASAVIRLLEQEREERVEMYTHSM
jgi:hypothetical protein